MPTISETATGSPGLRVMAGIETRRLARHPAFVLGVVLAYGLTIYLFVTDDAPDLGDTLSMPVIAAFFMGLTGLVAMARLTRSTDVTAEALGTAPGTEARQTQALVAACLLPFAAGLGWVAMLLVMARVRGVHEHEWWFDTMPDWQVWTILLALTPVACLGGALLGVLTGRWLRFPGASAVVVVAVVLVDIVGQMPLAYEDHGELRLWVPWAMWHSGTETDGTASLLTGHPAAYLGYLLCLCAAAALVAVYHDRTARTARLRAAIAGVTVLGLVLLGLAMTTGIDEPRPSEPVPYKVDDAE